MPNIILDSLQESCSRSDLFESLLTLWITTSQNHSSEFFEIVPIFQDLGRNAFVLNNLAQASERAVVKNRFKADTSYY